MNAPSRAFGQSTRQTSAAALADAECRRRAPAVIVDMGSGSGSAVDLFRRCAPAARYIGVDVEGTNEQRTRVRRDAAFLLYDGVHLPLRSCVADLVYSRQVLEHVADPRAVIGEIARVLRPGGRLVGSASGLEPFHSASHGGFTAYGIVALFELAGLHTIEMRPGVDGLTLIGRQLLGTPKWLDWSFTGESPLNVLIETVGRLRRWRPVDITDTKLRYAGHICFVAEKPAEASRG